MGFFERWLTLWVLLCIILGVTLGQSRRQLVNCAHRVFCLIHLRNILHNGDSVKRFD